jgi:hypothetical protein
MHQFFGALGQISQIAALSLLERDIFSTAFVFWPARRYKYTSMNDIDVLLMAALSSVTECTE